MHLIAQTTAGITDWTLTSSSPDTTLGELGVAMGLAAGSRTYLVDATEHPGERLLADLGLQPGSCVADADVPEPRQAGASSSGHTDLGVTGGWDTSQRLPLAAGDHLVGDRGPSGDRRGMEPPTDERPRVNATGVLTKSEVERNRFVLRVGAEETTIRPVDGSGVAVNGIARRDECRFEDGVAVVAGSGFSLLAQEQNQAVLPYGMGGGSHLFNRPPRTIPETPAPPVDLPERPEPHQTARKLSMAMMLAPIPIGVLMVLVFKRWMFAAFVLMTPIMALARWYESRRASRKDRERFETEMADALTGSRWLLEMARVSEQERRRRIQPDVAELRRRADLGTPKLWERQLGDPDFSAVSFGWADVEWEPPTTAKLDAFPELAAVIATSPPLLAVPLTVNIDEAIAVGIVGPRAPALAMARSAVLQATTLSGPADLEVLVVAEPDRVADWDWVKWLPHSIGVGGRLRIATTAAGAAEQIEDLLGDDHATPGAVAAAKLLNQERSGPVRLVIVDHDEVATAPASPVRAALRSDSRLRGIVVTKAASQLPRACGAIFTVSPDLQVTFHEPATNTTVVDVLPVGVSATAAPDWARAVARFADPEAGGASASIPGSVTLSGLRDTEDLDDPARILCRWQEAGADPSPAAVIGSTGVGPMDIDLVRDGPHGLIAGTTGSGKSELLRTIVTSMAANADPDHLNFVLVDFKGGGAFDLCAALPHVVSVVTDLDEHLAARALRCLKAELRYREERLRTVGASDLGEYLSRSDEPLPRLVVIIDEFATLAAELPDFLTSLVDVAQRGRSLGVHMILATQRPSGVVDKKIKANTNLRIALRVQDVGDSDDVIGTRQAAGLGRGQPGRAFARFGSSEIVEFQTAIVSVPARSVDDVELVVAPFALGLEPTGPDRADDRDEVTDAERWVAAIARATELGEYAPPRIPWPDPLPEKYELPAAHPRDIGRRRTPIGLLDLPDEQRQQVMGWSPERGNLLLFGVTGSALSSGIASIATGLAARNSPDEVHLYFLDYGNGHLAPLAELPHCGAHVSLNQPEQTDRLVALVETEMQRRRANPTIEWPLTALFIDNYAAVLESFEDRGLLEASTRLASIVRDGPGLGVYTFASATTERGIPLRVSSGVESRLIMRMGDPSAYMVFGLAARDIPKLGRLRAIDAQSKLEVQLCEVPDLTKAVAVIAEQCPPIRRGPAPVRILETEVPHDSLAFPKASISADEWTIPVGVRAADLRTGCLTLPAGEHALVAGGPRTGRSATLAGLARSVATADPSVRIVAITPRRSPLGELAGDALDACMGSEASADDIRGVLDIDGPLLVLVDDAESLPAELVAPITEQLAERRDDRHLIVAGRTDTFRAPGSWCRPIRESRSGIVLCPAPSDGDVFKTQLPLRRPEAFPTGRGFLLNQGLPERLQVALVATPAPAAPARVVPHAAPDDTCVLSTTWWTESIDAPRSAPEQATPSQSTTAIRPTTATALR